MRSIQFRREALRFIGLQNLLQILAAQNRLYSFKDGESSIFPFINFLFITGAGAAIWPNKTLRSAPTI